MLQDNAMDLSTTQVHNLAPFMAAPDTALMTKQKASKLGTDGIDTEY